MQFGMMLNALVLTAIAIPAAQLPENGSIVPVPPAAVSDSAYDRLFLRERSAASEGELRGLIPEYEAMADGGDTRAMFRLANIAKKLGNDPDMFKWLRRMADLGEPEGQYYLASVLRRTDDCSEARDLLQKSAAQGYEKSVTSLGQFYELGTCGPIDYEQSAVWYEKAARMGIGVAQNNLAWLYMKGYGVPQSRVTALAWFSIAARQNNNPRDRAVDWHPDYARGFANDIGKKLSKGDRQKAYALAAKLCGEDQVCSRILPELRTAIEAEASLER